MVRKVNERSHTLKLSDRRDERERTINRRNTEAQKDEMIGEERQVVISDPIIQR